MTGVSTLKLAQGAGRALAWPFRHAARAAVFEREVTSIAVLGATAFYITALATHTAVDSSILASTWPPSTAANLGGKLGAQLSSIAFFYVGVVAWVLPLPAIITAHQWLRQNPHALARSRVMGWLVAMLVSLLTATLVQSTYRWHGTAVLGGGVLGQWIAATASTWLGSVGTIIFTITGGLCGAVMIARRSISAHISSPKVWTRIHAAIVAKLRDPRIRTTTADSRPDCDPDLRAAVRAIPLITPGGPIVAEATPAANWASSPDASAPVSSSDTEGPRTHNAATLPYEPPPLSVFNDHGAVRTPPNLRELETTAALLVKTFQDFDIEGRVVGFEPGPVVTVFEFEPEAGVKQAKILSLVDDLALALRVDSILVHPVRGKRALGVQVPNAKRDPVHLGDVLNTTAFSEAASPLTFGLGKTISGLPLCMDLTAMPHLLVAGATGSGKSVCINSMLCSIIMKAGPADVRMILVDPKMLELSVYEGIPHLLMPVITDPAKASLALKWACAEMERRYKIMQLAAVRNIASFNEQWQTATESRRRDLRAAAGDDSLNHLPYILVVIDELADLMMTAPKDVESTIQRLAQKARASGIHMVLATQRPSVDIITGVIKANLPCRIAFQVVSKHDSRTILDLIGAEKLLGKGDMLFQKPGAGRLERLQGALISDDEVIRLVAAAKEKHESTYDTAIITWIDDEYARLDTVGDGSDLIAQDDEPKFEEAAALARAQGSISASFLQRHLKIGYNRAARIVESMAAQGLVDKADGVKPRRWLGTADRP